MSPDDSIRDLVNEVKALRADVRVLQGGQRTPLASAKATSNPDYIPNFGFEYDVWGDASTVRSRFSQALVIGTVSFSRVGPAGGNVFGVEDLDARLTVDGGSPIASFSTTGYGRPSLDVFTINMIGYAGFNDPHDRDIDLQIYEYEGEGAGATYPLASVSTTLFVVPVTAYT